MGKESMTGWCDAASPVVFYSLFSLLQSCESCAYVYISLLSHLSYLLVCPCSSVLFVLTLSLQMVPVFVRFMNLLA